MVPLLVHAGLGALTILAFWYVNAHLFRADWPGSRMTWLEKTYYATAVVSVLVGWYYNIHYTLGDPGKAGWVDFTLTLFDRPNSGSVGQDMIITNVILFPLWTLIDGPRRGLRGCWVYFALSLFTSFGFAVAFYLAAQERQLRWNEAHLQG
jgi:hypothetical protein